MSKPLRLLLLEDSPTDAELNERTLRKAGIEFTALRVETLAAFTTALDEFKPDLILADYQLPGFDGLQALAIVLQTTPETPFIFVTGAMGEERAVETIQQGAIDYILKDRLSRLPSSVQRALAENILRAQRCEAEELLRNATDSIRDAFIVIEGEQGTITTWNPAAETLFGYHREEVLGKKLHDFLTPPAYREAASRGLAHFAHSGEGALVNQTLELTALRKDAGEFPIELSLSAMRIHGKWHATGIVRDITERKQRETQIRNLNRILRTISICNEDLVHARCELDLLQAICRDIVEVGGYLLAWVTYLDAAPDGAPMTAAHCGDEAAFQAHVELERDPEHVRHCLTRIALRERQTATCNRLLVTDECGFGRMHEAGVQAILALPLLAGEQLLGALTIFSANPDAFDAAEIRLMEELSADLAYGIAALRTGEERDRYLGHFRAAMKNTVAAIARTLEMRDPYTTGHQQRVTALALAIARAIGLEERILEGLYFGAMIHDIGKIAVPAEILAKPTKLSHIEYQLIQQHPETGYEIVRDIDFPWPVADMILQHHERLDGSGYPHGLKDGEICLEARILAVADVVEAMSSHRPYRAGLGMDAALAEIERGSGQHFDSAVVAACVKVVRGNDMKLPE
ncbi:MAG: PAS domain S-box protein [Gallionellaceae bacterium]|nr:PAS domain S-box protein [Gallionellaceae bacterium]